MFLRCRVVEMADESPEKMSAGARILRSAGKFRCIASTSKTSSSESISMDTGTSAYAVLLPEVWDKVFEFLPFSDLQLMRLVCKDFKDLCNARRFKDKRVLSIDERNVKAILAYIANFELENRPILSGPFNFNSLKIAISVSTDDCNELFSVIGSFVSELEIPEQHAVYNGSGTNIYLLKNLKKLALRNGRVVKCNYGENSFMDLNSFVHIQSIDVTADDLSKELPLRVMRQLTREKTLLKLKTLRVFYASNDVGLLLNVLDTHSKTLECLELSLHASQVLMFESWPRSNGFQNLRNIKKIRLNGTVNEEVGILMFDAIPACAPLMHFDGSGLFAFNNTLLKIVIRKWFRSLKSLCLLYCKSITDDGFIMLSQMKALENLDISHCYISKYGLLNGIARHVNYTLVELILDGNTYLDEQSIILMAKRLPNLEVLSVDSLYDAVTDKSLNAICRHLRKLRVLVLDDCNQITDAGLLGRAPGFVNPSTCSISCLEHLNRLSLHNLRLVTDKGISGLRFSELRKLNLDGLKLISTTGIRSLVKLCPRITDFDISGCTRLTDDSLHFIVTGLKRLSILKMLNINSLIEKAIVEICEHRPELEELHICSSKGSSFNPETLNTFLPYTKVRLCLE